MSEAAHFEIVVIGSGPAGQKAAIQGAKAGRKVAVVEKVQAVGGSCVHMGTIPSKTLRETTVAFSLSRLRSGCFLNQELPENTRIKSLMQRLEEVVKGHERYIGDQLKRNRITLIHGRASFVSPHELEIVSVDGARRRIQADILVIASGSQPRSPAQVPVDHEHILDSDSLLSMTYLPKSLTVLGGGVIASEYASVFATLGVKVTMIEKYPLPLGFLDPELGTLFVKSLERGGGVFLGSAPLRSVAWNGIQVLTTLEDGRQIASDKLLCALGRVAPLGPLQIQNAGIAADERGLLAVNANCQTQVPHIYAVGDVIGPPALAASGMEQGRRAVCHALGLDPGAPSEMIPIGIYTIPEISSVGLGEREAAKRFGAPPLVGRAKFQEIARGHIAGIPDGLLKMVADPEGQRLAGVQIIGEGATELIHVGQMGLLARCPIDTFVENIFNFPTLAEAYRVAALDIAGQRAARRHHAPGKPQPQAAGAGPEGPGLAR